MLKRESIVVALSFNTQISNELLGSQNLGMLIFKDGRNADYVTRGYTSKSTFNAREERLTRLDRWHI